MTAASAVGGVSRTSAMPCPSYGLDPKHCRMGSRLREIAGSICSDCYACKHAYLWRSVLIAQERRLQTLGRSSGLGWQPWVRAWDRILARRPFWRWHDSGDVQSYAHLLAIVLVARRNPQTRFWLPTKESGDVRRYLARHDAFPRNLVVRVSAAMFDGAPPAGFKHTSTAHDAAAPHGFACRKRDGACGTCRACWNPRVANVSYARH